MVISIATSLPPTQPVAAKPYHHTIYLIRAVNQTPPRQPHRTTMMAPLSFPNATNKLLSKL
ncbi:microtubule-associated protein RP/EB family member 1 [Sesbania bispinosa]|nr:microtubule-associated protein RP/EB family member 1 [Sesbania bispinosa]